MRVLIAVHGYPPTHNGGAERRAARTAQHLLARGYDVRVICVESAASRCPDLRWNDLVQDGVSVRRLHFNMRASADPFLWSYDNPLVGRALLEMVREWRPSLLHLFGGYLLSASALRVAAANSLPTVVSLTDYWWLCHRIILLQGDGRRCVGSSSAGCARCHAESSRRYRLPARLWPRGANAFWRLAPTLPAMDRLLGVGAQAERAHVLVQALNSAGVLISPSAYLADVYLRHGVNPDRVRVCRQGVDQDGRMAPAPSETLRVGYIGQMKQHKGVHLLLEAWPRLRGTRPRCLLLYGSAAGEDIYGRRLRAMIERRQEVRWAGEYQGREVWRVLANLDVLVVPSRWLENSPNAILEAQAAGVPVIGSNLGGIAELVHHERNGLLFTVDDAEDLARQLQRLIDEPDLLQHLRQGATPVASVEDEMDQLSALYAQIVDQQAAQSPGSDFPRTATAEGAAVGSCVYRRPLEPHS